MTTQHYIPSAGPAPEGWTEAIWRAVQAKAITWDEAQALQDAALPRCLKHNLPIKVTDGGGMCMTCVEARLGAGERLAD